MRVVLDTNVVVSGIFFSGPPLTILEAWRDGRIELVLCEEILAEYERVGEVLGRQYVGIDASPVFSLIAHHGSYVEIPEPPPQVCEDPDDDKFLACAIAGNCQTLVTGDKHLLRLDGYGELEIIRPRRFVERYLT